MLNVVFSYCYAECRFAECRYAECRYAECRGAKCLLFISFLYYNHRHLSNIDCLTAHTACFACLISAVNGHSKKKG
jgi:hypothetical protein